MGAVDVANLVTDKDDKKSTGTRAEDRDRSTASWLLNRFRIKLDGFSPNRAVKGRRYRGEVVELGEQVCWKVPDLTQRGVRERQRPDGSARRRDRTNTSSQMPTECTYDSCSTIGDRRRSKNWLVPP